MASYSRVGYLAIGKETTENVAVTPSVFVPLMSEDIVTEYGVTPATPIAGNRAMNLRGVETAIPAPTGTLNILLEPETVGHFLNGVYGGSNSGQLMRMTSASGDWAVGDTATGVTSTETATVLFVSSELDYLLISTPSGTFTDGETIGNGSTGTGVLTQHDATVFGHEFTAPQATLPTYTIEIGVGNEAYRYTGVRFNEIAITQSDNIITAAITITARAAFTGSQVTAITTSGAGTKTITVEQTTGMAATDTIKIFRPSTGAFLVIDGSDTFRDVDAVSSETEFTITNLDNATAVGDVVVFKPQTPSYTIDEEFSWIGGSLATVDETITAAITASGDCIENFEVNVVNEVEARHCADGNDFVDRFPGKNFLKGLTGSGSFMRTYTDVIYLDRLRDSTDLALFVKHTGNEIGSTGQDFALDWRTPLFFLDPFNANIAEDDLIEQEMPFTMYNSEDDGYFHKALLVNDITSY